MITKNDCLSILVNLEEKKKLNIDPWMKKLVLAKEVPLDVLKFIADNRGIDVIGFYDLIRKNHNKNKSPLYKNLVNEQVDENSTITTLACLLVQILLYSKKLENKELFLAEARAAEISKILANYFTTFDYTGALRLLKLIRSDILCLEYLAGRRDLIK